MAGFGFAGVAEALGADGKPQPRWAERLGRWDEAALRGLAVGWPVILLLAAVATVANAVTVQADNPSMAAWKPWVLEGSSTAILVLTAWLPWWAGAFAPPERLRDGWRPGLGVVAVHLGVAFVFSLVHVTGMAAVRFGAYAALGDPQPYSELTGGFGYEFRIDLFSYAIFAAVFWLASRSRPELAVTDTAGTFDIRDGQRLIRAPVAEIVAASSAGNYVQFFLADGRTPLMRATLKAVETQLGEAGFVRTHRSWLVNVRRLTGLRPTGSGDWTVELGTVEAPVSRRYAHRLPMLRSATAGP